MMINVTEQAGIYPGAVIACLETDGSVTCENVSETGEFEIDACCNSLPHRDMAPCREFEEQVDCGPCSNGCGCGGSEAGAGGEGGGEDAVSPAEQAAMTATAIANDDSCIAAITEALNANKPEAEAP